MKDKQKNDKIAIRRVILLFIVFININFAYELCCRTIPISSEPEDIKIIKFLSSGEF